MLAPRSQLNRYCVLLAAALAAGWNIARSEEDSALRLVPFPKEVRLSSGESVLGAKLTLETPAGMGRLLGPWINEELERIGLAAATTQESLGDSHVLRLSAKPGARLTKHVFRAGATAEDYLLEVTVDEVVCASPSEAGLFYAAQTLRQLIRANRRGSALPCLEIRDWPSLTWRGFSDDMTRGPSAKLNTLQKEVEVGAELKMNLFHYYIEHQFSFQKHPLIGPKDGSLTPEELKALVAYAKPRHVEIFGSQQSFQHLATVLQHKQYADASEDGNELSPAKEGTYKLLDDLYSEQAPLLSFPWFNVCCDEVYGLDKGPSKDLVAKLGFGGVYVQHMLRIHDLLPKHGKRMAMWSDVLLQYPDTIKQIPKDTVILVWWYWPQNAEAQVIPFAKSGHEFLVCPSLLDWSALLPRFGSAVPLIQNVIREGAKHKAIGTLNTSWKDSGEELRGSAWHGYAWGAECAWNASVTRPEGFNRRLGAVLFGEKGDHFGQAVELLAKTECMAGMEGMSTRRFWENDFSPQRDPKVIRASAERLLAVVCPAIQHLEACRREAVVNQHFLDVFLFGARRMESMGRRMLDGLEAAGLYTQAYDGPLAEAGRRLAKVEALVRANRDAYEAFGRQFVALWNKESKPYALDRTTKRFAACVAPTTGC